MPTRLNNRTKGILSIRDLEKGERGGNLPDRIVAVVAGFVVLIASTSCVTTAECDATVPCDDGMVCYDYACRTVCDSDEDCGAGAICEPCEQDDAEGAILHCFESRESACLPESG